MTIKELCVSQEICGLCPFYDACNLLDVNAPFGFVEDDDKLITKSIIETAAKSLKSDDRMTNKEWVDFLSKEFDVSRSIARDMLHGLMKMKKVNNFNKQFYGSRRKLQEVHND